MQNVINDARNRMTKSEESLKSQLGRIRAGRANASLLDGINVNYYGVPTPLVQIASATVPEARVLMITPYDKTSLGDIEKAIMVSDIGINPANDGNVIRLVIPPLTEERRKELAKQVGGDLENAKVSIRNIRRDAIDTLEKMEKNKEISEDELKKAKTQVQEVTDKSGKNLDAIAAEKEKELLED